VGEVTSAPATDVAFHLFWHKTSKFQGKRVKFKEINESCMGYKMDTQPYKIPSKTSLFFIKKKMQTLSKVKSRL